MNKNTTTEQYRQVMEQAAELSDLKSAGALLGWDQEAKMPEKGVGGRAHVSATLAGVVHEKMTAPALGESLRTLAAGDGLDEDEQAQVKELLRVHDRAARVPTDLVRTLARTQSESTAVWARARAENDFDAFAPFLDRIWGLKREIAEAVGYDEDPYDALLQDYEPEARCSQLVEILAEVRDFLIPLVQDIAGSDRKPNPKILAGPYDENLQDRFGREIVSAMGFDMKGGRLDLSNHPFTSGIHEGDTRLTTRYRENLSTGLFGTIHEAGHGLYEQNLPSRHQRTPLGTSTSLGVHESQSRLWENMVGRGLPFWKHWYPRLRELFPEQLGSAAPDEFHAAINDVKPSFIRVESDEVTYNLHIILRFEIEREMLAGNLKVSHLPELWNAKFQEYLGLTPPSADVGVLQDIHWAVGLIGYFPTYSLGNLYAAQLYEAAGRAIPDLEDRIARGDLISLRDWLVENVHQWGRRATAPELIERATGAPLSTEAFRTYVQSKFGRLYGIE